MIDYLWDILAGYLYTDICYLQNKERDIGMKKITRPFNKVHHIGIVTADVEKTVKRLESYGIGRFAHPSLPGWLEKTLFKGKTFDKTYKFLWMGPFVHPMMYKIIDVDHSLDAATLEKLGLPPMKMEGPAGEKPKTRYKIYKAWMGSIILEIGQPVEGETPWMKDLKKKGEGLQHIGIEVDGIDQVDRFIKGGALKLGGGIVDNGKGHFGYYLDTGLGFCIDIFKGYY